MATKSILMVCMGNICRSPMAEGILRDLARARGIDLRLDSAGTIGNHVGEAPDHRAQACMRGHCGDISALRARQVRERDLSDFDLVLAMDEDNLQELQQLTADRSLQAKAQLIMDFAPDHPLREVPDPYYGGPDGFEQVYDMLNDACERLLDELAPNE
jgi:protein-tyrosine phosphatase